MRVILTLADGLGSEAGQIRVAEITEAPFRVGRSPDAEWTIHDPTNQVSRIHFDLRVAPGAAGEELLVTDRSSGGTSVDHPGGRLQRDQPARLGDVARLILPGGAVQVAVDRSGKAEDEAEALDVFGTRSLKGGRGSGLGAGARAPDPFAPSPRQAPAEPPAAGAASAFGGDDPFAPRGGRAPAPGRPAPAAPRREAPRLSGERPAATGLGAPDRLGAPARPGRLRDRLGGGDAEEEAPQAAKPRSFDDLLGGDDPFAEPAAATPEASPPSARPDDPFADDPFAEPAPAEARPAPPSAEPPAPEPQPSPRPASAPAAPSPEADAALRAFFEAAGLRYDDLPPERRAEAAEAAGRTFRALAEAMRRLLESRAEAKRELGVAGTQIEFGANPLKFSPTPQAAVEGLLRPFSDGYLSGEAAVDDALGSMQQHQMALISAIRSGIRIALETFDPDEIERRLESRGLSNVVPALRRAELWERFRDEYGRFAEQANDDIRMVFGRELDRLYSPGGQGGRGGDDGGRR